MRLIDADALKRNFEANTPLFAQDLVPGICAIIDRARTIDVVPHWIPCSERLPEKPYGCLVTVWDTDLITMDEFENILPYFVGWDGEQWNDADGEQCPFEIIAWMPLPKPYERKES